MFLIPFSIYLLIGYLKSVLIRRSKLIKRLQRPKKYRIKMVINYETIILHNYVSKDRFHMFYMKGHGFCIANRIGVFKYERI